MRSSERPLREAQSDAKIMDFARRSLPLGKAVWSVWVHGVAPTPTDTWFERDEAALSRDVLPTKTGGMYEVAIGSRPSKSAPTASLHVLYGGIATNVRGDSKGTTLRRRLYIQHCAGSSNIQQQLRSALERGWHVYVRWIALDTVELCRRLEALLLTTYDYAWDRSPATSLRHSTGSSRQTPIRDVVAMLVAPSEAPPQPTSGGVSASNSPARTKEIADSKTSLARPYTAVTTSARASTPAGGGGGAASPAPPLATDDASIDDLVALFQRLSLPKQREALRRLRGNHVKHASTGVGAPSKASNSPTTAAGLRHAAALRVSKDAL